MLVVTYREIMAGGSNPLDAKIKEAVAGAPEIIWE